MKTRQLRAGARNYRPAIARAGNERSTAQLANFHPPLSPAQLKLNGVAQRWGERTSVAQLAEMPENSRQRSAQLMMKEEMTLAQQVMLQHDTMAANMPSKSNAATHVSPENRKETEEEKKHQARMSNAWKVSEASAAGERKK